MIKLKPNTKPRGIIIPKPKEVDKFSKPKDHITGLLSPDLEPIIRTQVSYIVPKIISVNGSDNDSNNDAGNSISPILYVQPVEIASIGHDQGNKGTKHGLGKKIIAGLVAAGILLTPFVYSLNNLDNNLDDSSSTKYNSSVKHQHSLENILSELGNIIVTPIYAQDQEITNIGNNRIYFGINAPTPTNKPRFDKFKELVNQDKKNLTKAMNLGLEAEFFSTPIIIGYQSSYDGNLYAPSFRIMSEVISGEQILKGLINADLDVSLLLGSGYSGIVKGNDAIFGQSIIIGTRISTLKSKIKTQDLRAETAESNDIINYAPVLNEKQKGRVALSLLIGGDIPVYRRGNIKYNGFVDGEISIKLTPKYGFTMVGYTPIGWTYNQELITNPSIGINIFRCW